MSNISLYNIKSDFIELFEKRENGDITEEEYQEKGNCLAVDLKNKSINIIGYVRNAEVTIEAIKNEVERLTNMRKAIENKIDKFKEYVKVNMQELGLEKIETEIGNMSVAKNPVSVEIYDENLIIDEYKKEKITVSIDKTAIKNAMKEGKEVQGARLIEDKTSLRIK